MSWRSADELWDDLHSTADMDAPERGFPSFGRWLARGLKGIADALGLGGLVDAAERLISSALGRAAITALCGLFSGGVAAVACAVGTKAVATALVSAGGRALRERDMDDVSTPPGSGWTIGRVGVGYLAWPAQLDPTTAAQRGYLLVWFPGWPGWTQAARISQTVADRMSG